MKNIKRIALFVLFTAFFLKGNAQCPITVNNSDFDQSLTTGWTVTNSANAYISTTSTISSGNPALNLNVNGAVRQNLNICTAPTTLNFDFKVTPQSSINLGDNNATTLTVKLGGRVLATIKANYYRASLLRTAYYVTTTAGTGVTITPAASTINGYNTVYNIALTFNNATEGSQALAFESSDADNSTNYSATWIIDNIDLLQTPSTPTLSQSTATNVCPKSGVDINALVTSTPCANYTLRWFTDAALTSPFTGDATNAPAGTYYAAYVTQMGCKGGSVSVAVSTVSCCNSGDVPPSMANSGVFVASSCEAGTGNLTTLISTVGQPGGTSITYHTGFPATDANKITNPTAAPVGKYYAAFWDAVNNCYSPVSDPIFVAKCLTNVCPISHTNLNTASDPADAPAGSVLQWHTTYELSQDNLVANPEAVAENGVYWAAFYDELHDCYSPISLPVEVVFTQCPIAYNDINQAAEGIETSGSVLTNDKYADTATVTEAHYYDDSGTLTIFPFNTATDIYTEDGSTKAGTMTLKSDGTYTFIPASGFTGTAPISYAITDQDGGKSNTAVLSIEVVPASNPLSNNAPIANNDTYTVEEGKAATISVLSNDSDPDGDTITVTEVKAITDSGSTTPSAISSNSASPSNIYEGTEVIGTAYVDKTTGELFFTPADGYTGEVPFSYTISDGNGGISSAGVTVTVLPANATDNVYANDDAQSAPAGQTITTYVLTNDASEGSGTLTVTGGSVTIGGVTYSLTPDVEKTIPGVGKVTITSGGELTFVPAEDFIGTVPVEYTANNGTTTDTATAYLTLFGTAPIAYNDINQAAAGVETSGNVLTNDKYVGTATVTEAYYYDDSGALTALPLGTATQVYTADNTLAGTMTLNTNGTYTFVPASGFTGTVPVSYAATDDNGTSNTAVLYIEVVPASNPSANDAPIANNDTYTVEAGKTATVSVLSNDSDPDGDTITVTEVKAITDSGSTTPSAISSNSASPSNIYKGTEVIGTAYVDKTTGELFFTPAGGYTGEVPFSYTISDGNGGTASADVTVTVLPANATDNVYANDDAQSAPINTDMSGNILTNDAIEGTPGTLTVKGTPISANNTSISLTEGTLVISPDGSYTFTPNTNFVGTVAVPYEICDTEGVCDQATLYLTSLDKSVKYWIGTTSTDFHTESNWTTGIVPKSGEDVEFATNENNSNNPAVKDMRIPTGSEATIGNLTNATNLGTVVSAGGSLTITGIVTGSETNPAKLRVEAGAVGQPNGSLIVTNGCAQSIKGTVEFLAQGIESDSGTWNDDIIGSPDFGNDFTTRYKWQHFGIPVKEITHAIDYFNNAYVRRYDETYNGDNQHFYQKWHNLSTWSKLEAFKGYEITHDKDDLYPDVTKLYHFTGDLNFCSQNLILTRKAHAVNGASGKNEHYGLGQNIFGNSYTSAIKISEMNIPENVEKVVYLYNTGRFHDWADTGTIVGNDQLQAGNYLSIPQATASVVWDDQIPSMQGFLLKFTDDETKFNHPDATVSLTYSAEALTPNTKRQLAPPAAGQRTPNLLQKAIVAANSPLLYLRVKLESQSTVDNLWLFSQEGTTEGYDNGWDGRKSFGTPTAFIYTETPAGAMQVNANRTIDGTPISFRGSGDGKYKLTLIKSNLDKYENLHLLDLAAQTVIPLQDDTTCYDFISSNKGSVEKRFMIVNRPSSELDLTSSKFDLLDGYITSDNVLTAINYTGAEGTMALYTVSGNLIASDALTAGINLYRKVLKPGVYIMRLEANKNQKSVKLIVNK